MELPGDDNLVQGRGTNSQNSALVSETNRRGLAAWRALSDRAPELFAPTDESGTLPIVCASRQELEGEHTAEYQLDSVNVSEPTQTLPAGLAPLEQKLADGTVYGSFLVDGAAYRVKTLCAALMGWLEERGVVFHWNRRIDLNREDELSLPPGDVIWAAGVSTETARLLASQHILLQGVLGCWIALPNPGFTRPFKVLGVEPVNFVNATPAEEILILSGGYGWVGERPYDEASRLGQPIMDAFKVDVARFFTSGGLKQLEKYETAVCIRPSLPSGVPIVSELPSISRRHRVVLCVGHAAGGFTESPAVAADALDTLA
jgi:glycine/D-amino acid oxidase-like deaminating enzyme